MFKLPKTCGGIVKDRIERYTASITPVKEGPKPFEGKRRTPLWIAMRYDSFDHMMWTARNDQRERKRKAEFYAKCPGVN